MTAIAATRRSRAAELLHGTRAAGPAGGGERASDGRVYPLLSEGAAPEIAADIAERRARPTTPEVNARREHERIRDRRAYTPGGPSIYEIFCKPRGMSAACATCGRHVEQGANCPGRDPADDARLRGILPDCHSAYYIEISPAGE